MIVGNIGSVNFDLFVLIFVLMISQMKLEIIFCDNVYLNEMSINF